MEHDTSLRHYLDWNLFHAADGFVLSWRDSGRRQFALILLVTAIPVMPMLLFGYQRGHDLEVHLQSWMDASAQFRQGILCPRWASEANYGLGEPRFIFYPPLSWTLGGLLGLLLPWMLVPAAFVWLTMIVAAVGMWKLAADWLPSPASLVAALVYATNPYLLLTAYTRGAFGELLASAIFPFLLWGAFRIARDPQKAFAIVAVSFAAIWLCNLPGGVISSCALLLVLLITAILRRSPATLLYGAAAAATGFGLAAFALFPAFVEQKWVNIHAVVGPKQLPWSNFLFSSHSNMPRFNHVLSLLAVALIACAIAATVAARRMRYGTPAVWWSLTALCALSAVLMFPASALIWRALPELRFVQFPWRWLFPMCATAALLLSFAVVQSRRKQILLPLLACALLAMDATVVFAKPFYPHFVSDFAEKFRADHGYAGLREYTPLAGKGWKLPPDAPLVAPAEDSHRQPPSALSLVYIEVWSPERKVIRADLPQATTFNLKLLAYPAWQASVNGQPAALQDNAQTGQLMLTLPAGASRTEINFGPTRDRTVGKEISLASGFMLAAIWQWIAVSKKRAVAAGDEEVVRAKAA